MVKKLFDKLCQLLSTNWSFGFLCGMGFWSYMWLIAMLVQYLKGLTFAWIPR